MNSKYSNFLTVLLIIIILAIIGIIGFIGFKYYQNYVTKTNSEDFVDSFINDSANKNTIPSGNNTNTEGNSIFEGVEQGNTTIDSSTAEKPQYNGFDMVGTIEIPATNVKYPILDVSALSITGLETSVIALYGELNQVGNTTIVGHNYRNGLFFANNKKLNIGDKVYITDLTGQRLSYTIYNKYETEENDDEYMTRDTNGAREISLSTCTDDAKARLVIWAKADLDS